MKLRFMVIPLILFSLSARAEPAAELICTYVGDGLVQIDGIVDDFANMPELRIGSPEPRDAAFALRCAYDHQKLYLAVNVSDERLVRTRARGKGEDHLALHFGTDALEIYPSSTAAGAPLGLAWSSKGGPRPEVADSLQPRGWSVELALPLAKLPGYRNGAPGVPLTLEFHDADLVTAHEIEAVVTTGAVLCTFQEAAEMLRQLLSQSHLRRDQLTLDTIAQVDGEGGVERVVAGGKIIGVLGETSAYLELPVVDGKDVLSVELADLGGEGRSSLVVRTVEHGEGGSREVLSIWNLRGDSFQRSFAHEIGKRVGNARMTNRWRLVPRAKGKRGLDLVIQPGELEGFTEATWSETPASDMVPILLPWGAKKEELWHFEKGEIQGG